MLKTPFLHYRLKLDVEKYCSLNGCSEFHYTLGVFRALKAGGSFRDLRPQGCGRRAYRDVFTARHETTHLP